jgi:hypothetical protein
MADDADTQVLNAAVTIRGELAALVPADADALGTALDELIRRVQATPQAERPPHVYEIIDMLSSREPTRERFVELCPDIDTDRGAADLWAFDQVLAGEDPDDNQPSDLISIICQTCHYENKLEFYPLADELPECQNPDVQAHLLKLP